MPICSNFFSCKLIPIFIAFLGSARHAPVSATPPRLAIFQQPADQTASLFGDATFRVAAQGDPPLTYQWRLASADLFGKTNSTLTITNVQRTDAGNYSVVIANSSGSVTSQVASLAITPFQSIYCFGFSWTDTQGLSPTGTPTTPNNNPDYWRNRASNGPMWPEWLSTNLGLAYISSHNYARGASSLDTTLNQVSVFPAPPKPHLSLYCFMMVTTIDINDESTWEHSIQSDILANSNAVTRLYAKGARSIVVESQFDQDPSERTSFGTNTALQARYHAAFLRLNTGFVQAMRASGRAHPDLRFFFVDMFSKLDAILADPVPYGFTNTDIGALSELQHPSFAGSGATYLFWDEFHPTSKLHRLIAGWHVEALASSIDWAGPYSFTTLAGSAGNSGSADGKGSAARFFQPFGLAMDSQGIVYVADTYNHTIRKVTAKGETTTVAGLAETSGSTDGVGAQARFNYPQGLAVDPAGNVYVADSGNSAIRKISGTAIVTTVGGPTLPPFNQPLGVAVDPEGNIYVADTGNYAIRKVTPAGVVTTLAGLAGSPGSADGTGSEARFGGFPNGGSPAVGPTAISIDGVGNLYIVDSGSHTIRKVTRAGVVTTLAGLAGQPGDGDGVGSQARFGTEFRGGPFGIAADVDGNVYITDSPLNNTIRKIAPAGIVTTLAGAHALNPRSSDGVGSAAGFWNPAGIAVDLFGNLYVTDSGNNTIRKGSPALWIQSSGADFGFSAAGFSFRLTGPLTNRVVIEASADLAGWIAVQTNTLTGALQFNDQTGNLGSKRFYRVRNP